MYLDTGYFCSYRENAVGGFNNYKYLFQNNLFSVAYRRLFKMPIHFPSFFFLANLS